MFVSAADDENEITIKNNLVLRVKTETARYCRVGNDERRIQIVKLRIADAVDRIENVYIRNGSALRYAARGRKAKEKILPEYSAPTLTVFVPSFPI